MCGSSGALKSVVSFSLDMCLTLKYWPFAESFNLKAELKNNNKIFYPSHDDDFWCN